MSTPPRKLDHIRLAVDSPVEHPEGTWLEYVRLVHNPAPELSLDSIVTRTVFLGKELAAPLMVTGMTGGHSVAARINCAIARAAASIGVAMGVGSQRAAIEHPELSYTYRAARECGGDIVLVANIGAPQLVKGYGVQEAVKAVEMIEADALAVHLNPAQEAFQPEGDTDYRGVIKAIERLVAELPVPVIVKETGHGLSQEAVYALRGVGVRFFDVSGSGGTSWVRVEYYRALAAGDKSLAAAAETFSGWGNPTALAVAETRWAAPDACIVASGGVRSGLDAAKAIALGANLAGVALPAVKAYAEAGEEGVRTLLETLVRELRVALFLAGARSVEDLYSAPLVLGEPLRAALLQRGVNLDYYMLLRRGLGGMAACR